MQTVIDATQKETAIDQQLHSCERLISQRHQTILRLLSSAGTASKLWRVRELYCPPTYQISERFDPRSDDVGNPLVEQLGRHLRWPSVNPGPIKQGNRYRFVLPTRKAAMRTHWIVPTGTFRLPWLRFFRSFSSVVRQMPGYNSQRRGMTCTLPN